MALGWSGRPAEDAGSRKAFPKGWPNPLAATIDKPQTWDGCPAQSLFDKKQKPVTVTILLAMAWIVGVLAGGTALRGRSLAAVVAAGEMLGKEIDDKRPAEVAATVKMIHNSMIGIIAFAVVVYWAG